MSSLDIKQSIRVAAALIVDNEKFLIAKRSAGRHLEGYWELPGGKIEPNETPSRACFREVKEELGCEIVIDSYFLTCEHQYDDRNVSIDVYIAHLPKDQKIVPQEQQEFRYISSHEIDEYDFAPADIQFLPNIKNLMTSLKRCAISF